MTLAEVCTCEMYLIIHLAKYFSCLSFVICSGRRKIFNSENFLIYDIVFAVELDPPSFSSYMFIVFIFVVQGVQVPVTEQSCMCFII